MKRSILIGLVLVGILSIWVVPRLYPPVSVQAAPSEAPPPVAPRRLAWR